MVFILVIKYRSEFCHLLFLWHNNIVMFLSLSLFICSYTCSLFAGWSCYHWADFTSGTCMWLVNTEIILDWWWDQPHWSGHHEWRASESFVLGWHWSASGYYSYSYEEVLWAAVFVLFRLIVHISIAVFKGYSCLWF